MQKANAASSDELFRWADQIPSPLWDDLEKRPATQAAEAVGGDWHAGTFTVPLVGIDHLVDTTKRTITRAATPAHRTSYQSGVVLLTALAQSLGVPPSGRMVTPQELEGGTLFFTGAHSLATKPLARRFGSDAQALLSAAESYGGKTVQGADFAVCVPGLPFLPLYVLLWTADQEFPARAVIGIDDRALFHLDLAGVLALTNVMVGRLTRSL